jgi:hypothetical protein
MSDRRQKPFDFDSVIVHSCEMLNLVLIYFTMIYTVFLNSKGSLI